MRSYPDYDTPSGRMTDDEMVENIIALAKRIAFECSHAELMQFQRRLREGDVFD